MGLATGTNLADPVAIIDALVTELGNQNWTIDNNIAGGIGTREVYFSKASGDTFNGEVMTFGLFAASSDLLELSGTGVNYTTWTNAGTELISNNFNNIGQRYRMANGANSFWETRVEDLNTGANYLNHWIFTPVDTSTGGTPADHQYIYMVIEIQTGVYRSFFFGEIIKEDGETWTGGQFFEGNTYDPVSVEREIRPFAGAFAHNIFQGNRGIGGMYMDVTEPHFVTSANKDFMTWGTVQGFEDANAPHLAAGAGSRNVGEDHHERGVSAFSGQTLRWPAEFWCEDENRDTATQPQNVFSVGRIPDFFFTNLANFTPGVVVIDDTERFLPVPDSSKGGSLNTGNRGFMIRNPLL